MPINDLTIHLGRAEVLALALVVPLISTAATSAYADNESAAAIEPPYRPLAHEAPQASLSAPHATSGASGTQYDDYALDIYRPGISDR